MASEQTEIDAAIARFPATFGLRNHEGVFRISRSASYMTDALAFNRATGETERRTPVPMLYTQRLLADGTWADFAKGTEVELVAQIRLLDVGR